MLSEFVISSLCYLFQWITVFK